MDNTDNEQLAMLKQRWQAPVEKNEDIVRVLRLVEYEGPRSLVEAQISNSIHGTRRYGYRGRVRITAVTLDQFPRVLEEARQVMDPRAKEPTDNCYSPLNDVPGSVL